jgi:hypothetical protein
VTNGQSLRVTISVGLALSSDHEQAPDAERIVADTYKQLYLSKQSGRNTWSYMGRRAPRLDAPVRTSFGPPPGAVGIAAR